MYAKVTLEIDSRNNVLIVPKIALVDSEGKRGIYQPNDENRAEFKPVTVGLEDNEKAEITRGCAKARWSSRPAPARCVVTTSCWWPAAEGQRAPRGGPGTGNSQRAPGAPRWCRRAGRAWRPRWSRRHAGGRNRRRPGPAGSHPAVRHSRRVRRASSGPSRNQSGSSRPSYRSFE